MQTYAKGTVRTAAYLATQERLDLKGKLKCNLPNRPCGDRCIPPNWKCRVKGEGTDSHSRVVAGDPLAGAASIARGRNRLQKGLRTGNVVEIQAGRAAIARGIVKAVPGQNLKQKQELRANVEAVIIPVAGALFGIWALNRGHEAAKTIVPGYKDGIGKAIEGAASTSVGFVFDRIPVYGETREAARRRASVVGQQLARAALRGEYTGPDVSPTSNARIYTTLAAQGDRSIAGLKAAIEDTARNADASKGYQAYRSTVLSNIIGAKVKDVSIYANAATVEHLSKQFGLSSSRYIGSDDTVKKTYLLRDIRDKLTSARTSLRADMAVRGLDSTKSEDVDSYLDIASGYAKKRFSRLNDDALKSVDNSYRRFVRDLVSPEAKDNSVSKLSRDMYDSTFDSFNRYFDETARRVREDTSPTTRVLMPSNDSPLRPAVLGAGRFLAPRVGVKIPVNSANVAELVLQKTYHELGLQPSGYRSNRKSAWSASDSDVRAAARDLGWDGNGGIVSAYKVVKATGSFDNLQEPPVLAQQRTPRLALPPATPRPARPARRRSKAQKIADMMRQRNSDGTPRYATREAAEAAYDRMRGDEEWPPELVRRATYLALRAELKRGIA